MAADAQALPSEAIEQQQPTRPAAPEEIRQHRALRGDPRGGRQNDGGVPRAAGHRAVHPGHHEYCKCYNHITARWGSSGVPLAPQDGSLGDSRFPTLLMNWDKLVLSQGAGGRGWQSAALRERPLRAISWRIIGSPGAGHA